MGKEIAILKYPTNKTIQRRCLMGKENYKKITEEESFRIAEMIHKDWIVSEYDEIVFYGYIGVTGYYIGFFNQPAIPPQDVKGNKRWRVPGNDGEIRHIVITGMEDLANGEITWELAEKIQAGYGEQVA